MKEFNNVKGCGMPVYSSPEIKMVELDSAAILCASNEGNFGIGDIPGEQF